MNDAAAAQELAQLILDYVRDPDGRVRVEDAVSAAAAAVGEACLAAPKHFSIDDHTYTPGQPILSDLVNGLLTGDVLDWEKMPPSTVFSMFHAFVLKAGYPASALPAPQALFRHVAATVGGASAWGTANLTVPPVNWPRILPLRAAFELRPKIDALMARRGIPPTDKHVFCLAALLRILGMVVKAIDPAIVLSLALETTVAIAKMAPMTAAHLRDAQPKH